LISEALMTYASGHVVAAASAVANVRPGRFGMKTPLAMIQGPTEEMPSTGSPARSGVVVSIIEMQNATMISNVTPRATIVCGRTTLYRCSTKMAMPSSTAARLARRFPGCMTTSARVGCVSA
jgi:hypothetical protein